MRKHLAFLVLFFINTGLFAQVEITLTVTNNVDFTNVKLVAVEENSIVSEAVLSAEGKAVLQTIVKTPSYYKIQFSENNSIFLVLSNNEKLVVTVDANKLEKPSISGSPESERLYVVNGKLADFTTKENELLELYEKNKEAQKSYVIAQIEKNPGSLTNFFFLDFLDAEEDTDIIGKMVKSMVEKHPNNKFVKELQEHFKAEDSANVGGVIVGSMAPDIAYPNPEGKVQNLSSLKGKVVLLDFWASWCGPCRRENPNTVLLYEKYKSKGFEIFGVSLDKDKAAWLKAIKDDRLTWIHVSELQAWDCAAVKTYGVKGIPFTVLIGKDGKVIETGLRGEALAQKLSELFDN